MTQRRSKIGGWVLNRKSVAASILCRRAEPPEEDGEPFSVLGRLRGYEQEDDQEAQNTEEEMVAPLDLNEDTLDGSTTMEEETEQEASRRGARQIVYNLSPSRQYVLYIAKHNAVRTWTKDGPGGRNKGCIEVQIAVLTERIRSMVLHIREFRHDFKCRVKLVTFVSARRRLLDKLSWKDLESYLRVREELKIRHVYRMEALIGRLPAYKYATRDRKRAPGRRVTMRLKKTKKLLSGRLAAQLRQGKNRKEVHKTQKAIASRKWFARSYDDVENLVAGQSTTEYVDPLSMP